MTTRFKLPTTPALTEAHSIALAERIVCEPIHTPLSSTPIQTTYVRQGTGFPPILLLHGFDSSVLEFRRLLPLLATQTTTWAVDLLGFGFTERQPELVFSPESIKTHLYYFWKTLIARPVILVGASMGGAAAIDFTLTHPIAVEKLVLIDSAGFGAGPAIGKFLVPPLDYWATQFLKHPLVRQQVSRKSYFDHSWASADALACGALHLNQPGWSQALIAFTQSGGYGSFRDRLSKIQPPTLILWGQQDRILGTADADNLQAAIPKAQQVWIANCGHVPHLEAPSIAAERILEFSSLH
jgi:pimeloyl-ACP methyl ester carboxylesterase